MLMSSSHNHNHLLASLALVLNHSQPFSAHGQHLTIFCCHLKRWRTPPPKQWLPAAMVLPL